MENFAPCFAKKDLHWYLLDLQALLLQRHQRRAGLGNAQIWASWWVLALQQPAGGRSQMADGEGREGRWWPVGGLARTKPAALRATRLLPCVVTLGLASNTPRRRPLNTPCG